MLQHAQENLDFHDSIRIFKTSIRKALDSIPGEVDGVGLQERKSRHRKSLMAVARGNQAKVIDFTLLLQNVPPQVRVDIEKQLMGLQKLLQEISRRFLLDGPEEVNLPGNIKLALKRVIAQGIPESKVFDDALACIESSLLGNWIAFTKSQ